jgi:hypothetical protein
MKNELLKIACRCYEFDDDSPIAGGTQVQTSKQLVRLYCKWRGQRHAKKLQQKRTDGVLPPNILAYLSSYKWTIINFLHFWHEF